MPSAPHSKCNSLFLSPSLTPCHLLSHNTDPSHSSSLSPPSAGLPPSAAPSATTPHFSGARTAIHALAPCPPSRPLLLVQQFPSVSGALLANQENWGGWGDPEGSKNASKPHCLERIRQGLGAVAQRCHAINSVWHWFCIYLHFSHSATTRNEWLNIETPTTQNEWSNTAMTRSDYRAGKGIIYTLSIPFLSSKATFTIESIERAKPMKELSVRQVLTIFSNFLVYWIIYCMSKQEAGLKIIPFLGFFSCLFLWQVNKTEMDFLLYLWHEYGSILLIYEDTKQMLVIDAILLRMTVSRCVRKGWAASVVVEY